MWKEQSVPGVKGGSVFLWQDSLNVITRRGGGQSLGPPTCLQEAVAHGEGGLRTPAIDALSRCHFWKGETYAAWCRYVRA